MTKRIVRRNGLTIALVLIVLGLICVVGISHATGSTARSIVPALSE